MRHSRSNRRRGRAVAGSLALVGGLALIVLPTLSASAAGPPTVYGAAAEGKALHENTNVVASVDPALAASRATAAVNPQGALPVALSSLGYSSDPGTLGGAVIFAPGNPTQTSNFPTTAEAFFPEPDQEHVAKCAFNNDATDTTRSGVCDQTNTGTQYAVADATPKNPTGPSSRGFASYAGANAPGSATPSTAYSVTSESSVIPDPDGNVNILQENKGHNIGIAGTPIVVKSFEASSHLKATTDGVTGDALCTIDMNIGGQAVPASQVQAALSALPQPLTGQVTYAFTAPTPPVVDTNQIGGSSSCTGAILEVSNPTTGNSITYTFGETKSEAAKVGSTLDGGGAPGADAGATPSGSFDSGFAATPGTATTPSPSTNFSTPAASTSTPSTDAPAPAAAAPATPNAPQELAGPRLIKKKIDGLPIGLVTAAGAAAIGLGTWLLIGAVGSLASRGGIRLAGWQGR